MLQKIKAQSSSWTVKFVIIVLSATFVFFGTSSIWNLFLTSDVLIQINDDTFSPVYFENEVASYKERIGGGGLLSTNAERQQEEAIRTEVLGSIINSTLIRQVADESGLSLSSRQLDRLIVAENAFQIEGVFSSRAYNQFLSRQRISSGDYKQSINNRYQFNAFYNGIFNSAAILPQDLDLYSNIRHQEYDYHYMQLDPADFLDDNDEEYDEVLLRNFYEENIDSYYLPAQYTINYYTLESDDFIDQINVTESDIQDFYYANYGYLIEESQISLRQIFFADEEGINDLLEGEMETLKQQIANEDDFISAAQASSQDEQTAPLGGALGNLTVGDLLPEFVDILVTRDPDDRLLGPVRTNLGVHLLWISEYEDADIPVIDDVRDELIWDIRYARVDEYTLEVAENFSFEIFTQQDIDEAASRLDLPAGETATFSLGDGFAESRGADFIDEVLALEDGQTSDVIFLRDGGYMAFNLLERREEMLQAFNSILPQVEEDYRYSLALLRAEDFAKEMLKMIEDDGQNLDQALELLPADLQDKYSWREVTGRSRANADEIAADSGMLIFSLAYRDFPFGGVGIQPGTEENAEENSSQVAIFVINNIEDQSYSDLTPDEQNAIREIVLASNQRYLQGIVITSMTERSDIEVNRDLAGVR